MTDRPAVTWTWVRWLAPVGGIDVGSFERMPWVIAAVYLERGECEVVEESAVPVAVRRGKTG